MVLRLYKYLLLGGHMYEKALLPLLTLSFLLVHAACGMSNSNSASDNLISASMMDFVTEVEITHILSGTESQWTVNSNALEALKN